MTTNSGLLLIGKQLINDTVKENSSNTNGTSKHLTLWDVFLYCGFLSDVKFGSKLERFEEAVFGDCDTKVD